MSIMRQLRNQRLYQLFYIMFQVEQHVTYYQKQ